MKVYQYVLLTLAVLVVLGDVADVLNKLGGGQQTSVGIRGADAFGGSKICLNSLLLDHPIPSFEIQSF